MVSSSCGMALSGRDCGEACGLCPRSRSRWERASASGVYPAGKLQWHFACGFDFRHGLWSPFVTAFSVLGGLLIVPVGGGTLRAVSKVES